MFLIFFAEGGGKGSLRHGASSLYKRESFGLIVLNKFQFPNFPAFGFEPAPLVGKGDKTLGI